MSECKCPHCGKEIPIEVIEQMAFDYDPIELVTLPADVAASAGLYPDSAIVTPYDCAPLPDTLTATISDRPTSLFTFTRRPDGLWELDEREPVPGADPAHDPGENYANAETGKPLTMDEVFRAADTMMGLDVGKGDDQTETAFICNNCRAIVNPNVQHVCPFSCDKADAPTFLSK